MHTAKQAHTFSDNQDVTVKQKLGSIFPLEKQSLISIRKQVIVHLTEGKIKGDCAGLVRIVMNSRFTVKIIEIFDIFENYSSKMKTKRSQQA